MKFLNILIVLALSSLLNAQLQQQPNSIVSRINSDRRFISQQHKNSTVYAIEVLRTQSDHEGQINRCQVNERTTIVSKQIQLFRLGSTKQQNRHESVYQLLTSLDDNENMIEEFEKIGEQIFIITTQAKGYFINEQQNEEHFQVNLNLKIHDSQQLTKGNIQIIDFNQRPLIVTNHQMVICEHGNPQCDKIEGYDAKISYLIEAKLFTQGAKHFIFLLTGQNIITYEFTANGKLQNKKQYDHQFFKAERIHIRDVQISGQNKLIFLDSLEGLREVTYKQLNNFDPLPKIVYEQAGCYKMVSQNNASYIVMSCTLNLKSYFIMQLLRQPVFGKYQPKSTIFRRQTIYDIGIQDNTIMSRVFSGIKLYWASKTTDSYPYDYLHAGNIFLHNAVSAKTFLKNGIKIIYLATDDEMRRYEIQTVQPYVTCYSPIPIKQQYTLTYIYPCSLEQQKADKTKRICKSQEKLSFEAWEHKQIKINTMLLPFILSLIGVIVIGFILIRCCKRFNEDIEKAKLKYNIESDFQI